MNNMNKQLLPVLLLLATLIGSPGCASSSVPSATGFISDYSQLKKVDSSTVRYVSPQLAQYRSFIVDPVQIRTRGSGELSGEQRAEVARYFHTKFVAALETNGYRLTRDASAGTARVRLALTDVQEAKWWLNVMPTTKLTGAGVGGASMEGEVIDSITGEQLAAVVRSGRGSQFELDTFSQLDDVKDVIDSWAKEAEKRLRELRAVRAGR